MRFERNTKFKIDFTTINMDFYRRFTSYCYDVELFRTNTFGKHIRNIKGVVNYADIKNIPTNKEFRLSDFRSPRETTTNIFLTEKEILEFVKLDFHYFNSCKSLLYCICFYAHGRRKIDFEKFGCLAFNIPSYIFTFYSFDRRELCIRGF
jgi:hypothetical protein